MIDLIGFDPKTATLYSKIVVPAELGLEHILRAVRQIGLPQYNTLRRRIDSGVGPKSDFWHQIAYPGPVMHLISFNGGYILEVYANGNGYATQNAWDLTMYLTNDSSIGNTLPNSNP